MANRPITITARIQPKNEVSSEPVAPKQEQVEDVQAVDEPMTMPKTKAELIALYQTEALEINNSVQAKEMEKVARQRVALYERQLKRTEFFYTIKPLLRPTYMVQTLKSQFVEYQQFQMARALDQRGIIDLDKNEIYVIEDSEYGVEAACNAGLDVLAIRNKHYDFDLHGAKLKFNNLFEIIDYIKNVVLHNMEKK